MTERQIRTRNRLQRRQIKRTSFPIDVYYYHKHAPVENRERFIRELEEFEEELDPPLTEFIRNKMYDFSI